MKLEKNRILLFASIVWALGALESEVARAAFFEVGLIDTSGVETLAGLTDALGVSSELGKKESTENYGLRKAFDKQTEISQATEVSEASGNGDGAILDTIESDRDRRINFAEGVAEDKAATEAEKEAETDVRDKNGVYPYVQCQSQLIRAKGGFEVESDEITVEFDGAKVDPISKQEYYEDTIELEFPSLIDIAKRVLDKPLPTNDPRMVDPFGAAQYAVTLDLRYDPKRSNFSPDGDRLQVQARLYRKDTGETLGYSRSNSDKIYTQTMLKEVLQNTRYAFIDDVESIRLFDSVMTTNDASVATSYSLGGMDLAAEVAADKKLVSPYEAQTASIVCFVKSRKEPLVNELRTGDTVYILGREIPVEWHKFGFEEMDFRDLLRRVIKD